MTSTHYIFFYPPFFFLMIRPPPRSTQQGTLFPYTTLFRSDLDEPQSLHFSFPGAQVELVRSEEHTSELQSRLVISYAVFCLKKKKNHYSVQLCSQSGNKRYCKRRKALV